MLPAGKLRTWVGLDYDDLNAESGILPVFISEELLANDCGILEACRDHRTDLQPLVVVDHTGVASGFTSALGSDFGCDGIEDRDLPGACVLRPQGWGASVDRLGGAGEGSRQEHQEGQRDMNLLSHGARSLSSGPGLEMARRLIVGLALLIFGSLLLAGEASAGTWTASYSLTYPMGDRDSKSSLRRVALEEARIKAASEVGMVVLNEQQLKDDRLVEQTRLVSAAMVKVKVLSETIGMSGGRPTVEFELLVEIDDSELGRQLTAMRSDVRKDDLIAKLSRENKHLRGRLESARGRADASAALGKRELGAEEIDQYPTQFEAVRRQTYLALNGGEAALAAAEEAEAEASLVEKVIMEPLLHSKLSVAVKPWRRVGKTMEIPVSLSWDFDVASMKQAALQFSTPRDLPGRPYTKGFCARTDGGAAQKQSRAGMHLLSDAVAIEVTLGESKTYFVIGGEANLGHFCVVGGTFSAPRTVLLSLPETEAQAVGSISVKTVRMSKVAAKWRSMVRNDLLTGDL